jgi:hypothetical protein
MQQMFTVLCLSALTREAHRPECRSGFESRHLRAESLREYLSQSSGNLRVNRRVVCAKQSRNRDESVD